MLDIFKNKVVIIFVVTMLGVFLVGALKERAVMQNNNYYKPIVNNNIK